MDKEDWTQEMEQRAQWSAPAWAAYCTLYSISCVSSSFSTGYTTLDLPQHTFLICRYPPVDLLPLQGTLINGAVIAGPLSCHDGTFAQREKGRRSRASSIPASYCSEGGVSLIFPPLWDQWGLLLNFFPIWNSVAELSNLFASLTCFALYYR